MPERESDEHLAEMLEVAEEAGEVEAGEVTIDAMDLVRVLQEVTDRRADDLRDKLIEWAHTEAGGKAAWKAWYDAMLSQHRDVSRHQARFEILDPPDQQLHLRIAVLLMTAALDAHEENMGDGG